MTKYFQKFGNAIVLPLYKGKGSRSEPGSNRPISLCSCLGKVLERVVHKQLVQFLSDRKLLSQAQHGFIAGRSIVTNMLTFDKYIGDCLMSKHPYDVISFDFQKAFDKAPHQYIINAISQLGICGKALLWSASFLAERTQQIRIGSHYSSVYNVIPDTVQGSILGPNFNIILSNSLLSLLSYRSVAYVDDFKFIVDVRSHTWEGVQCEIDKVVDWSEAHLMPLSAEKCAVLHCGQKQLNYAYVLGDQALKTG